MHGETVKNSFELFCCSGVFIQTAYRRNNTVTKKQFKAVSDITLPAFIIVRSTTGMTQLNVI
jgi:hypothetical protein